MKITKIWITTFFIVLRFFFANAQITTTITSGPSWTDVTLTQCDGIPNLQTTNYNS